MQAIPLRLHGLVLFKPTIFQDERGYFFESYRKPVCENLGLPLFVQDNISFSQKGVIRALHFQKFPGQAKLVQCLEGKIFDVAVDIRPQSKTFGEWEGIELDSLSCHQLFIPVGFAHGFCVLSQTAKVLYKVSALYDPKTECSIRWNDPRLNIQWPIEVPILSERDKNSPFFDVYEELHF